jgi:hypothetical protein
LGAGLAQRCLSQPIDQEQVTRGFGGEKLVPVLRTVEGRELEKMRGFILRSPPQFQFADVEIRIAEPDVPGVSTAVVRGGKYGFDCQLAEVEPDDWCRPRSHVELCRRLGKPTR